jgi:glycosyltransferase involved in cell wall biosynthesis
MSVAAPVAHGRGAGPSPTSPRLGVIAAVPPLTGGAAQFNAAMVAALRERVPVELLSWRRLYPPLLYRGQERDERSQLSRLELTAFALDWHDPRTWRRALRRLDEFGAEAIVLPWLHPVSAPPYRWLLRHAGGPRRVVICHNVLPHEHVPGAAWLTRSTLSRADLLVTHAPQQAGELRALGLGGVPILEAFHPRFVAADLSPVPDPGHVARERSRLGDPDLLLLFFGAVRPYKGLDLALEALARVDTAIDVRLVVAGRFWESRERYDRLIDSLGLSLRVHVRDGYVTNEDTALLFSAADASLLPYRSATQSGVAQLSFAYGTPVIATRVGGLPAAIEHGRTGFLCPPDDPSALAAAIERLAAERARLAAGVEASEHEHSFERYADALIDALGEAA